MAYWAPITKGAILNSSGSARSMPLLTFTAATSPRRKGCQPRIFRPAGRADCACRRVGIMCCTSMWTMAPGSGSTASSCSMNGGANLSAPIPWTSTCKRAGPMRYAWITASTGPTLMRSLPGCGPNSWRSFSGRPLGVRCGVPSPTGPCSRSFLPATSSATTQPGPQRLPILSHWCCARSHLGLA
jgi:hypothetical protein